MKPLVARSPRSHLWHLSFIDAGRVWRSPAYPTWGLAMLALAAAYRVGDVDHGDGSR